MSDLSHGILLLEQGRLEDAEACFVGVLAKDPDNHFVHSRLAVCRMQQTGRKKDALSSAEEAIRLRPDDDYYHCLKALILADLHRPKEAIEAADLAISINPDSSLNFAAKASALCSVNRWKEAEENCRKALAIDPDDEMAHQLLTSVLRLQGKGEENAEAVFRQLSENPEDSLAHTNAGWTALTNRDHRKAEEHFREALRLDPEMEAAREGLLESFKARSWFYRMYLSYCFFMQRFTGGMQFALIIGAWVAFQLLKNSLKSVSPIAVIIVSAVWLTFILWVWLAPGIGNFLVFLDPSARRALRKNEMALGLWIGLGAIIGIGGLAAGGVPKVFTGLLGDIPVLTALGATALASTIPASLTWTNDSGKGRRFFGGILIAMVTFGLVAAVFSHFDKQLHGLIVLVMLGAVACTWLGNVPALRRDDSG